MHKKWLDDSVDSPPVSIKVSQLIVPMVAALVTCIRGKYAHHGPKANRSSLCICFKPTINALPERSAIILTKVRHTAGKIHHFAVCDPQ